MTTSAAFRLRYRRSSKRPERRSMLQLLTLQESISYGIPTFSVGGRPVVYLGGWKKHISIYPIPDLDKTLEPQVAPYLSGRGTAKFQLGKPLPHELITVLVERLAAQRHR
jgi:uncharacterized protein YdhG (YjbR/CyaY superfamily)